MRYLFTALFLFLFYIGAAQTHVFAQLTGSPVNTTGWTMTGAATVGNIIGSNNSEIILCNTVNYQSGAIFFNQPINLNLCNKWIAEFDFRMFDGNSADGIAFCFIDVPPTGFVTGGGLGIPGTANGLKVGFDTYLNCAATGTALPKLELRWGAGYDECWNQPTVQNTSGLLSVMRSPNYCHAKIVYDNGNISVYINNVLAISGFQTFNFTGYLGFTASTGGFIDNHSIKNVVIYTNMPPSEAGASQTICSGQSIQLGTTPNLTYTYSWTPSTGVSNPVSANPNFSFVNNTDSPVVKKLFVNTAFLDNNGCASKDSVTITILPVPSVSISTNSNTVCKGEMVSFTATATNAGTSPVYQWKVNGLPVGANSSSFSSSTLNQGDIVSCELVGTSNCGGASSNQISMTITQSLVPAIVIAGNTTGCSGVPLTFTATVTNAGTLPQYSWKKNGFPVGSNSSSYTDNNFGNGDQLSCELFSNAICLVTPNASSNVLMINILQNPVVVLDQTPYICQGTTRTLNAGNFNAYQWQDGSSGSSFTVNNTGTYWVKVTDAQGCKSADTVSINLVPSPSGFLPRDSSFCEFNTFNISGQGNFNSYLWNNNDITPGIAITQPGMYWLEVVNQTGCKGRDSVVYALKNCTDDIYFPDAFTPDNNGRNDLFRPLVSNTLKTYSFAVYNRWGQQVFFSKQQGKGWDGTINGSRQPSGIFVWTCTYQFEGQGLQTAKGTVILMR